MAKEKKINVLGMDVFQTAAVKRNYLNVKPYIAKRKKLEEKLDELQRELEVMRAEILDNDQHTGRITKSTCGFTLTSEQAIFFIDHPEEFEKFKAEQEAPEVSQDITAEPQEAPQEVQETQEEPVPAPVNDPFEQ